MIFKSFLSKYYFLTFFSTYCNAATFREGKMFGLYQQIIQILEMLTISALCIFFCFMFSLLELAVLFEPTFFNV